MAKGKERRKEKKKISLFARRKREFGYSDRIGRSVGTKLLLSGGREEKKDSDFFLLRSEEGGKRPLMGARFCLC